MGWQPQGPGQIPGYLIAFCLPEFLRCFPLGVLFSASCPEPQHSAAGAGSPQAQSWEPARRCWLDWKLIVFQSCEETASAAPAEELPLPRAGVCLAALLPAAQLTTAQQKQLHRKQGNHTHQGYRKGRRIGPFIFHIMIICNETGRAMCMQRWSMRKGLSYAEGYAEAGRAAAAAGPGWHCWWHSLSFQPLPWTACHGSSNALLSLPQPCRQSCTAAAHVPAAKSPTRQSCTDRPELRKGYLQERRGPSSRGAGRAHSTLCSLRVNASWWPQRAVLLWSYIALKLGTAASRSPLSALLPDVPSPPWDRQCRVRLRSEGVWNWAIWKLFGCTKLIKAISNKYRIAPSKS